MAPQEFNRKWYDNKLAVYLLCVLFFPVGLYALWKNQSISKAIKIIVTVIIAFAVIISMGNKGDKNSQDGAENDKSELVEAEKPKKEPKKTTKEKLKNYLNLLKNFDNSEYTSGSIANIENEDSFFRQVVLVIKIAEKEDNIENKKLAKQLRKKLKAIQISEFPKMRQRFVVALKREFKAWERNIAIEIKGKNYTQLDFISIDFTDNLKDHKKNFKHKMDQIPILLRFKQINYKITRQLDDKTINLKTPKDDELRYFYDD